jgi:hypothetical protein
MAAICPAAKLPATIPAAARQHPRTRQSRRNRAKNTNTGAHQRMRAVKGLVVVRASTIEKWRPPQLAV